MCEAKTWVLGKAEGLAVKQGNGRDMFVEYGTGGKGKVQVRAY
jgi:hypothetical protein